MAVMVEEIKSCPKKDIRRCSKNNKNNQQQKMTKTTLLETISQGGNITSYKAEDGSVRMKMLVKKQDLKQILSAMNNAGIRERPARVSSVPVSASSAIERRLFELMRKKKANAQAKGLNLLSSSWRPHLQSIPEEHSYLFDI